MYAFMMCELNLYMQNIELLSPAKTLNVDWAAINHGADAVYIVAQFGGTGSCWKIPSKILKHL